MQINKEASTELSWNPICIKNLLNLAYHDLEASFIPYIALFNLQTWLGNLSSKKPRGCFMNVNSDNSPYKNAFFTSNCLSKNPLEIAIEITILMARDFTTGL